MRVLHFSKSDSDGGAARAAYRLHAGLKRLGVESSMVVGEKKQSDPEVFGPRPPLERITEEAASYVERQILRLTSSPDTGYRSLGILSGRARHRASVLGRDVVQLHWVTSGFLSVTDIRKLGRTPIVWRLPDQWPLTGTEHYSEATVRMIDGYQKNNRPELSRGFDIERWNWNRKKRHWTAIPDMTLVAPSSWLADAVRQSPIFRGRRVEQIPTGIDTHIFQPRERDLALRSLNLPRDRKYLIFCANNPLKDPRKGFSVLEEALRFLSRSYQPRDLDLLVVGGEARKAERIAGFPVHHLGLISDQYRLSLAFSASDASVVPSKAENLANTAIESLSCGTPVVAMRVGGMPDVVKHKRTGFLAQTCDGRGLAEGIRWVLDDRVRNTELSAAARHHALRNFDQEKQAESYRDLYQDILPRKESAN